MIDKTEFYRTCYGLVSCRDNAYMVG